MHPFKKSEKEREDFLRNIRFIDRRDFQQFDPDPNEEPLKELVRIKRVRREYHHEIRREKGEMRILHLKLFLLGHEGFIKFIRHLITGRSLP
ncbi:MAG: hypothetical protein ABF723_00975 [Lentilactobacillus hilgardii]|uniref:hypothetical protein n=1 Tax=Lentilactobacillus hilgardii TaxID=1588 RepID=UPI001CC21C23|nr:hypothetical protein [Lentilactobacillus hilgardii]MBZ2199783.1 hypothetical protein [Lentilactobacillus hilgardii]MBZ2203723.1 hypothetical protein [Lentilactobacillus hilgardii]